MTLIISLALLLLRSSAYASYVVPNKAITIQKLAPKPLATTSGGAGSLVTSVSTGTSQVSVTSTTLVSVPNLSATLVTTGRPVMLRLNSASTATTIPNNAGVNPFNSANGSTGGYVAFLRDGAVISVQNYVCNGGASSQYCATPASAFSFIDQGAAAGTHTYTVQSAIYANAGQIYYTDVVLQAYEL